MNRTFKSGLSIILLFFTSMLYGQELPNFTGVWILEIEKSNLEAQWAQGITKGVFKIVHEEPSFKLWRSFIIDSAENIIEYQILTNGQEQKGKYDTTWTLIWQHDTLLLTIDRIGMVSTVEYYLTEQNELIAEERLNSDESSYHNRWVFVRMNN